MKILEFESKQKLSREEAAALLRELADTLARNNEFAFEREGVPFHVAVADEVELEVELEVEDDETSLEIELSW